MQQEEETPLHKYYESTGLQVLDCKKTHLYQAPKVGPFYPIRDAGHPKLSQHYAKIFRKEQQQQQQQQYQEGGGAWWDEGAGELVQYGVGGGGDDDDEEGAANVDDGDAALPYDYRMAFGIPTVPDRVKADGSYPLRPPKGRGLTGELPPVNSLRHRAR